MTQSAPIGEWDVGRPADNVMALRWQERAGDWLLLVTIAGGEHASERDEFVRTRDGARWSVELSSNEERFGGSAGAVPRGLTFRGPGAVLLREVIG